MRAWRLSWCLTALLVALSAAHASAQTVILVRHAEKAAEPGDDPPLSAGGAARAQALAGALRDAHVTAIITTQYRRTRDTAGPVAKATGLTPEVVRASDDTAAHARDVAARIRQLGPRAVVLVVGHSNTVPAIVAALDGPRLPEICDAWYARMFTVVLRDGAPPAVVQSAYGRPDPADARCEGGMRQR